MVPWRRQILVAVGLAALAVAGLVAGAPKVENRLAFGTFSTQDPPPRIDYCDRRYYPDANFPNSQSDSGAAVAAELSANGESGLTRVGTTPSGMPILANVMTAAQRASDHTKVCAMVIWVETGRDQYLPYGLSGGP
jgi:hypothetical protein